MTQFSISIFPGHLVTHFLPLLFLTMISYSSATGQSYLSEIEVKWVNSAEYLERLANALPDDLYDFKPTEEEMTFKAQLLHIANNMLRFSRNQLEYTEENSPESPGENASPLEVRQFLKAAFQYAGKAISQQTEESLNMKTKFFSGPMSRRQIINIMNDHVTHHRGQIIVYLRLNNIDPGRYVGW